jgi:hypothetical protein
MRIDTRSALPALFRFPVPLLLCLYAAWPAGVGEGSTSPLGDCCTTTGCARTAGSAAISHGSLLACMTLSRDRQGLRGALIDRTSA